MVVSTQQHKYKAYTSATQTVAKTQQIVMLYDGVISLIQQAKEAVREKRIEDRYNLLMKASAVIHGLQGCLDFENGKEIANVLYSFYSSIDSRLFSVHRDNSIETCDEVINDLKQMRDAWVAVDETLLAEAAPAARPISEATAAPSESGSASEAPAGTVSVTLSA
ncbi:MAG: flagellar export chaperone FliS [Alphaproteobacteria bacterium]|nr:flagellar export chaperone FliS [Alphaproteobacteria bacterium]